ncbi:MAG: DNA polymerase III subunit beta [Candidatus Xenobia bacterium]
MHMTIPLKVLQAGLKAVAPATKTRSPLPILKHVLIEGNALTCTDMDLRIEHTLTDVEMHLDHQDKACTVDYKTLADWVNLAKSNVTLHLVGDQLHVSAGKSRTTFPTLPAEEFPASTFDEGERYDFPDGQLQQVIRKVDFARAQAEETRAVMTGMLFSFGPDGLTLVGCDGRRLAFQTIPGKYGLSPSVLARIDVVLGLQGDISLSIARGSWLAESGSTRIGGRIMEGNFPNWAQVSKFKTPMLATINRTELIEALRRVLLFAQDSQSPHLVKLEFSPGALRITAETATVGSGSEEMALPASEVELTIAFNGKYLLEGLVVLDSPTIDWGFQSHDRAAHIRVGEWSYVIMPVQLRQAAHA